LYSAFTAVKIAFKLGDGWWLETNFVSKPLKLFYAVNMHFVICIISLLGLDILSLNSV